MIAEIILATSLALTPASKNANFCAPADLVSKILVEQFKEEPVIWAVNEIDKNPAETNYFVIFSNEKGTAYTLVTITGGIACVIGVGKNLMFRNLRSI